MPNVPPTRPAPLVGIWRMLPNGSRRQKLYERYKKQLPPQIAALLPEEAWKYELLFPGLISPDIARILTRMNLDFWACYFAFAEAALQNLSLNLQFRFEESFKRFLAFALSVFGNSLFTMPWVVPWLNPLIQGILRFNGNLGAVGFKWNDPRTWDLFGWGILRQIEQNAKNAEQGVKDAEMAARAAPKFVLDPNPGKWWDIDWAGILGGLTDSDTRCDGRKKAEEVDPIAAEQGRRATCAIDEAPLALLSLIPFGRILGPAKKALPEAGQGIRGGGVLRDAKPPRLPDNPFPKGEAPNVAGRPSAPGENPNLPPPVQKAPEPIRPTDGLVFGPRVRAENSNCAVKLKRIFDALRIFSNEF